jgi:hypothetical protein
MSPVVVARRAAIYFAQRTVYQVVSLRNSFEIGKKTFF